MQEIKHKGLGDDVFTEATNVVEREAALNDPENKRVVLHLTKTSFEKAKEKAEKKKRRKAQKVARKRNR